MTSEKPSAKVILDSISPLGHRLTTIEATMHRFVLAEFNTHRIFSRNSASSRAIPVEKQLQRILENPAFPLVWAAEQPGMQGGGELEGRDLHDAQDLFRESWNDTVDLIKLYLDSKTYKSSRLHKSLINRLLEPFMWHTVIVTSTDYSNFFKLRCSPLAQPEIRVVAEAMREAYFSSTPTVVNYGEFHTPYIDEEFCVRDTLKVSAARCARVSLLTHDGVRSPDKDVELFEKLISANPKHESPLEHVASPARLSEAPLGNFSGWHQLRHNLYWVSP